MPPDSPLRALLLSIDTAFRRPHGQLFPDVAPALRRWRARGLTLAVYGSTPAAAQRAFFARTPEGDLRPIFSAFFDASVGPGTSSDTYTRIGSALEISPTEVLFLGRDLKELDAASAAGMRVGWVPRGGDISGWAYEDVRRFPAGSLEDFDP